MYPPTSGGADSRVIVALRRSSLLLCQHEHMFTHYNATPVIILSILDMMFAGLLAPCTISDGRKILSTSHGYLYDTGVDKGGPEGPGPQIAGQKRIFLLK